MTKSELRKVFLTKRQEMLPAEREMLNARIVANFFRDFDLTKLRFLHCFIPLERLNEVDTRPIFQRIWSDFPNIQTVVPRVNQMTGELESLKYGVDVELVHNKWHIGEPTHDDRVEIPEIDMVLVPLVCFDAAGHRVGYGKGFYDRFLARCRAACLKIGLSFFAPVDEISDAHDADVRLDFCITPDRAYELAGARRGAARTKKTGPNL